MIREYELRQLVEQSIIYSKTVFEKVQPMIDGMSSEDLVSFMMSLITLIKANVDYNEIEDVRVFIDYTYNNYTSLFDTTKYRH
jgi:hypothetical protein